MSTKYTLALATVLTVSVSSAHADLTIAIPDTEDSLGFQAIVDGFPSGEVTIVKASYDELFDRASTAAELGSGEFDIIMMDDPWITYFAENGYLEELTGYYDEAGTVAPDSDFLSQSLALCRYPYGTGAYVCLPFQGNAQMFFYDWRQFERHGVYGAPETWDDVIDAARGITRAGQSQSYGLPGVQVQPGLSKYGYVYRGAEGNPIVTDFMPFLWSYNGQVLDEAGHVTIDTPEAAQALDTFLQLANYAPPGARSYGPDETGRSLALGVSASSVNWPNWVARFENPDESVVVGRIAYGPIPSGTTVGRAEIGHWVLGIASASANKNEAFDFITWATSREQQVAAAENGNPPVRFSVFTDPDLIAQDKFRHYPMLMESIMFSRPRPRHIAWVEMERALGVQLSRALRGEILPQEALKTAQSELQAIVDSAR